MGSLIVTDEERTFFRITIPCHKAAGNIIAVIASKDNHDPKDVHKDDLKELSERQKIIIEMIIANPFLSAKAISDKISEKIGAFFDTAKSKMVQKWYKNLMSKGIKINK